jgi:oxygen-independent coproporphyrinogen-3 oxidase
MPGLYIHIPFCRQACIYCDFHFSVNLKEKEKLVDAICKEIVARKSYLQDPHLQSVYFGGGTPSVLSAGEIEKIMDTAASIFSIDKNAEITFEINPEDAKSQYLSDLKKAGINRLSVGLQSFNDAALKWMNRVHRADQSRLCVADAQAAGFENISIDLIYGSRFETKESWRKTLQEAFSLGVQHISSYNLTVEPKTPLDHFIRKKAEQSPDNELGSVLFDILMEETAAHGYDQYEISNFCKPGFMAVHNSNYWKEAHYLGVGPSAHSYNGTSRRFNVKSNAQYVKGMEEEKPVFEEEILSLNDKYNEYVMTRLRTSWGCNTQEIRTLFGEDMLSYFLAQLEPHEQQLQIRKNNVTLTQQGRHFADGIASDLFRT